MADVIVLGAGMVGVSSALALQERGHNVLLLDRSDPGSETSYGNAGLIQAEAVEPYAFPRDFTGLLRRALGQSPDVYWSLSGLQDWVGPVLRYYWYSSPKRYQEISKAYAALIRQAIPSHAPWVHASGASELITQCGWHQGYRTEQAFAAARKDAERLHDTFDVRYQSLSSKELKSAVPHLIRDMAGAIHWTSPWSCSDPQGLVRAYARLFEARGGTFAKEEIETVARNGTRWQVTSKQRAVTTEHVVVALGPWSAKILQRHIPKIVPKRGYHLHFPDAKGPEIPFMDAERATFMSPMRAGLRVLTGAELGKSTGKQMQRSHEAAASLFELGAPLEAKPWSGTRPCMPDMLPRIGQVEPGLWMNTGHGHQGFTLGPATAQILADRFENR